VFSFSLSLSSCTMVSYVWKTENDTLLLLLLLPRLPLRTVLYFCLACLVA
jgi:hypothetical protein